MYWEMLKISYNIKTYILITYIYGLFFKYHVFYILLYYIDYYNISNP